MEHSRDGREASSAPDSEAREAASSRSAFEFERLEHELAAIRSLLENAVQGVAELDAGGRYLRVNQAYAAALGYDAGDLPGLHWHETLCAEDTERAGIAYQQAREQGTAEFEARAVRRDGSRLHSQIIMTRVLDRAQRSQGLFCFLRDITVRKQAEEALRQANEHLEKRVAERTLAISEANRRLEEEITERDRIEKALRRSEERYRTLYHDNPSMFFTVDRRGRILSVNSFGAQQLGYAVDELVGQSLAVLNREGESSALEPLRAILRQPAKLHRCEKCMARKDGTPIWMRVTARVGEDAQEGAAVLIVCEDITESRKLSEQLSYQASHDTLTGLVNRREFESRLRRVLETAQKEATEHALCYLDLDQFKIINDTCGHVAGDTLLRQLGDLLREQVRKRDTVARLGGDEFGILMEHCTLAQAWRAADAVRRVIEGYRFLWEDKAFTVGASIGLVPLNQHSGGLSEVLRDADTACYAAKDRGRNRIQVYRHGDSELVRRQGELQWAARLSQALEQDRFLLSAQPIARLDGDTTQGADYQLILHMQGEDGDTVRPSAFLAAAQRYNLCVKIDLWVIRKALQWLADHREYLERLHMCCINLSGQSLGDEDFLELLVPLVRDFDIPSERICFQVAESAAVANLAGAMRFIKALRVLGFSFALDDYGSGLSSFAYLKNLSVDYLKIDAAVVAEIAKDPVALAMVRSINDIAHVLGRSTIAEGADSPAVMERLRELGVDYAQGRCVGEARPLEALLD